MNNSRWKQQWAVPSSSGGGDYIVSLDQDDTYACSCPAWTRNVAKFCPDCNTEIPRRDGDYCRVCGKEVEPRRERRNCKHIVQVRLGGGTPLQEAVMERMTHRR